jgi:hypothetical protein
VVIEWPQITRTRIAVPFDWRLKDESIGGDEEFRIVRRFESEERRRSINVRRKF